MGVTYMTILKEDRKKRFINKTNDKRREKNENEKNKGYNYCNYDGIFAYTTTCAESAK